MGNDVVILILEAMVVYFLVLWYHSLRHRFGPVGSALIRRKRACMFCLGDGIFGALFQHPVSAGITFVVGFNHLLHVSVAGRFRSPVRLRRSPSAPGIVNFHHWRRFRHQFLIAALLHMQMDLIGNARIPYIPLPSLRINTASVLATLIDLVFLAWHGNISASRWLNLKLWLRAFLTLLGVMWLDVLLFATGEFAGTAVYWSIMKGTLDKPFRHNDLRTAVSLCLSASAKSEKGRHHRKSSCVDNLETGGRGIKRELSDAHQEIERRKKAEGERDKVISELKKAVSEVKTLRGLLPICSHCKKIRDDNGYWNQLESYIQTHSEVEFTHGICPECVKELYPDLKIAGK